MIENLISDAHCHNDANSLLLKEQRQSGILATINCASPEEWQKNKVRLGPNQRLSFGVHPWQSDKTDLAALQGYFNAADVIGEIGLDSLWTDIPLSIQRPLFQRQLQIAADLHKPVILHTKGCEDECLAAIRKIPNRYFVHWYSAMAYQQDYLDLGCYMSIGADVISDPAVAALAERVSENRLLLESDGIESLEWAWHRKVGIAGYARAMTQLAGAVADIRHTKVRTLQKTAAVNLKSFWG